MFLLFVYFNACFRSVLPPENLFEYLWPPEQGGEFYMLQEQISEYLGIKSFKRKYPGEGPERSSVVKKCFILISNLFVVLIGLHM